MERKTPVFRVRWETRRGKKRREKKQRLKYHHPLIRAQNSSSNDSPIKENLRVSSYSLNKFIARNALTILFFFFLHKSRETMLFHWLTFNADEITLWSIILSKENNFFKRKASLFGLTHRCNGRSRSSSSFAFFCYRFIDFRAQCGFEC